MDKKSYDIMQKFQDKISENQGLSDGEKLVRDLNKSEMERKTIAAVEHYNQGLEYSEKEKYDKALECFKKVLELNAVDINKTSAVFYNIALICCKIGKYDEAIKLYQKVIKINKNIPDVFYNMGLVYEQTGKFTKALEYYKKTVEVDKNYDRAFYNMGYIYANKSNYDKAIECFKKVVAIDKTNLHAFNNIGVFYNRKGKYDEAIKYYQKALEIKNEPGVLYNMGNTYSDAGNYDEAIKYYEKALKLKKNYHEAICNMGFVYLKMGDLEKAKRFCLKSIELGNIDCGYITRGHIYFAQWKLDEAYKCYKKSLSNYADKKDFYTEFNKDFQYLKQYGVSYDNYMKIKNKLMNNEQ
jgi:superkiller protein 3